ERLWFLEQLKLTGSAYNMPVALRLEGELDVGALEKTFTELVRRHESLRTRFVEHDGTPFQVIDPPEVFRWTLRDVSSLAAEAKAAEVARAVQREIDVPFDLAKG